MRPTTLSRYSPWIGCAASPSARRRRPRSKASRLSSASAVKELDREERVAHCFVVHEPGKRFEVCPRSHCRVSATSSVTSLAGESRTTSPTTGLRACEWQPGSAPRGDVALTYVVAKRANDQKVANVRVRDRCARAAEVAASSHWRSSRKMTSGCSSTANTPKKDRNAM